MSEMDSIIITGLTMWLVQLCRRQGLDKFYVPPLAFLVAGLCSLAWAWLTGAELLAGAWRQPLQEGLWLGAVAGGLYGFGRAVWQGREAGPLAGREQPPAPAKTPAPGKAPPAPGKD
ncbi:MAG: hypothetical protein ACUVTU_12645 [Desulfurispora sp.]|uniref:hypothetical protein n=1 Tax=Desulfurispora sp. TaxID=3014275 RepID=UPI004049262D